MSDVASVCKLTGTSVSASLASRTPPVLHYSQPDFQLRVSNVLDEHMPGELLGLNATEAFLNEAPQKSLFLFKKKKSHPWTNGMSFKAAAHSHP